MSAPTIQSPRGTRDLTAQEIDQHLWIVKLAKNLSQLYGFQEIATPILESTEVFKRSLGKSSDIVYKEMFSFLDKGKHEVTLRPEGTASVLRAYLSHAFPKTPYSKFFYFGPMFRYERPQKGRQRQFHQFGVEWIGNREASVDVEIISLAYEIFKKLGIQEKISLEINTLGSQSSRTQYRKVLIHFLEDKKKLLSSESQSRLYENPFRILDSKNPKDQEITSKSPLIYEHLNKEDVIFFESVCTALKGLKIPFKKNPFLVRGLDYYSQSVFEFIEKDKVSRQNTLLAGGRYDDLVPLMGGSETPATGWAAGIERIASLTKKEFKAPRPVVLIFLHPSLEMDSLKLVLSLREEDLFVERIVEIKKKLSWKMEKAHLMNAKAVLILGEKEKSKNKIKIKEMDSGEEKLILISSLVEELKKLKS